MCCSPKPRMTRRGFTLVEQLIVIALLVAVVGFGGIRMLQVYQQNNSEHATKDLIAVLRFLQMKSIEEGRVYELSVSENTKQIVVKRKAKDERDFKPVRSSWIQAIRVGKSLSLELDRAANILFYPDGSTSKGRLILTNETGERSIFALKNRIGTVEVSHG